MAKQIERYQADDGTVFSSMEQAEGHDALCAAITMVMASLLPTPKGDFGNDCRGYLQQNPTTVTAVKVRLCELAAAVGVDWFQEHLHEAADIHPMSYGGRVMSECGPKPLSYAWNRLSRIDEWGREWEQPFFALERERGCQYPYGQEPVEA